MSAEYKFQKSMLLLFNDESKNHGEDTSSLQDFDKVAFRNRAIERLKRSGLSQAPKRSKNQKDY